MNPHQDFIDARRAHIARAVERGKEKGLHEGQMIVMLADSLAERDTWPSPPPDGVVDAPPASTKGVECVAMNVVVAFTLLDNALHAVSQAPLPGFVRVLAFCDGTAFFTHARVNPEV